jgi:hypothetical protein
MPISYGTAFGGRDVSDPDDKKHRWYSLNHAGRGFHSNLHPGAIEGKPLPNTEEMGKPVEKPDGKYHPMAYGPVGRAWDPRVKLAGTYDQKWVDEVCPFLPADFNDEYYQAAPPDQRMPYPKGGEDVVLVNLTAQGRTAFKLPRVEMPVTFFLKKGAEQVVEGVADTIVIEPDRGLFSIVYRATFALKRDVFEVTDIFVGPMSRGWKRARALGKIYCASLDVAIRMPPPLEREKENAS